MTDREKLEKVLEFVTQMEDKFYKPIEEGKYEPKVIGYHAVRGCLKNLYLEKIRILFKQII